VVKVIQRNPSAAKAKYAGGIRLGMRLDTTDYPLHITIKRGASFKAVDAIYKAYPKAIRSKCDYGRTLLHVACTRVTSPEVISLLLDAWPEALYEEDDNGFTPIFLAVQHHASLETLSLLTEACPSVIKQKDRYGRNCLHHACSNRLPSKEVATQLVSFLLEKWPDAAKEKDILCGSIPLNFACACYMPLGVIQLLLETWPSGVKERDRRKEVFVYRGNDENIKMCLSNVASLLTTDLDHSTALKIMDDFTRIQWVGGIALLSDLYPSILQSLERSIPFNVSSYLLFMIGQKCKLMTMFEVLRNRPDLLNVG